MTQTHRYLFGGQELNIAHGPRAVLQFALLRQQYHVFDVNSRRVLVRRTGDYGPK